MLVETRKTTNGTEYWNTIEKRTVFVPTGVEPNFKVTVNLKSMLKEEQKDETPKEISLEEMNTKQLKQHAKDNEIELPVELKKRDEILDYLLNNNADDLE